MLAVLISADVLLLSQKLQVLSLSGGVDCVSVVADCCAVLQKSVLHFAW